MMYRIVLNESIELYGPTEDQAILDPQLEMELNSAGSLTFTIPPNNLNWDQLDIFKDEIEVWEENKIIWFGRPLEINRDWNNQKVVTCEGALSYFNDSIQRPKEIEPSSTHTMRWFLNYLLKAHNSEVPDNRKIFLGNIDPDLDPDSEVYRDLNFNTTADCLQSMVLDTNGGYFILRKEFEEGVYVRYLDWVKEMPYSGDQPIQFGLNLLDISQDLNGADICTVLIPTGEDDLMITDYQDKDEDGVVHEEHSDEIYYRPGLELYGRVVQQKEWSDASSKGELWRRAKKWLLEKNTDIPTIECEAADLHYLDDYAVFGAFRLGSLVQVTSAPHNFVKELPIYKMSLDLSSGVKQLTIGTAPKRELSDIVKHHGGSTRTAGGNGGTSGGAGTGGSGGGASIDIPVKKVTVNNKSVMKNKIAKVKIKQGDNITVSTDENGEVTISGNPSVKDVKVNGTSVVDNTKTAIVNVPVLGVNVDGSNVVDGNKIAQISIPVTDVQVDGTSVVDGKIAKIQIPEPPVIDVQVDGTSVVENKIAKINIENDFKLDTVYWTIVRKDHTSDHWHEEDLICTTTVTITEDGYYAATMNIEKDRQYTIIEPIENGYDISCSGLDSKTYISNDETLSCLLRLYFLKAGSIITFTYKEPGMSLYSDTITNPYNQYLYEYDNVNKHYFRSNDTYYDQSKSYYYIQYRLNVPVAIWIQKISNFNKVTTEFNLISRICNRGAWGNGTYIKDLFSNYSSGSFLVILFGIGEQHMGGTNLYLRSDENVLIYNSYGRASYMDSILNEYDDNRTNIRIGDANTDAGTPSVTSHNIIYGSYVVDYDYGIYAYYCNDTVGYSKADTGQNFLLSTDALLCCGPLCGFVIGLSPDTRNYVTRTELDSRLSSYSTKTELDDAVSTLQSNFQDGVDDIYDACVSKGSTPASHALADVVDGILAIDGGGGSGDTISYYNHAEQTNIVQREAISNLVIENLIFESEVN
jgi:hypothetical protein